MGFFATFGIVILKIMRSGIESFAAIDFETANEFPTSVCSVGIVIVRDGEICDSFYSLIKPEPDYYRQIWASMELLLRIQ